MINDRIGQRYGRLVVIEKAPSKHGSARWWCLCDCGKKKNVSGSCLQQGRVKSCGCLRKEICKQRAAINSENNQLSYGESAFNLLYAVYRHNAEIRNRDFTLTKEDFKSLTSGTCFYCGAAPFCIYQPNKKTGEYIYNGVDRQDNSQGYVLTNCVTCCKTCNWMKRTLGANEFISACQKVVDYTNHKKSVEISDSTQSSE